MTGPRILVAGIGNIFLGDDAFGVEVVQRLMRRPLPEGVRVVDFGIRGFDLVYALLDSCDVAVLVDAAPRGDAPGTLYVIEPQPAPAVELAPDELMVQTHAMDPVKVLRLAKAMGGHVKRVLLVGCEPEPRTSDDDVLIGMSDRVRAAVDEAVGLVESVVAKLLRGETETVTQPAASRTEPAAGEKEAQTW